MRIRPKNEIERTVSHKGMTELKKIEREKRLQRREERRERAIGLQRGMSTRVTDQERNRVMTNKKKVWKKKHPVWKKICG